VKTLRLTGREPLVRRLVSVTGGQTRQADAVGKPCGANQPDGAKFVREATSFGRRDHR
jgi:hypothetical protein